MHACVFSNQSILPLIILQPSNQTLFFMFALLHREFRVTGDKQCACCIQSKKNPYVYTLFFEFILSSSNSSFLMSPRRMRGISTFIIYCVSRHLLIIT